MRRLSWIITVPLALIFVAFAVSNLEQVVLNLWPLPFALEVPLYAAMLVTLLVGAATGAVLTWFGQARHRRRAREAERRVRDLEREAERLRASQVEVTTVEGTTLHHAALPDRRP